MFEKLVSLWRKLSNRRYRETFALAHTANTIAAQIAQMREDRGLTQAELAELADMKQSRISILESPDNYSISLKTLQRLGAAFDVAVMVRFVPFSELAKWSVSDAAHKYSVVPFANDSIEWRPVRVTHSTGAGKSFAFAITSPVRANRIAITSGASEIGRTVVTEYNH